MHNEPLGGIYGRYSMLTMNITEQIEVSVNGERAALLDLNPRMSETDQQNGLNGLEIKTPPIRISAGPQRITAAFIQRLDGPVDDLIAPLENTLADVNISFGVTALPHMRDMTILGPSQVTGVSETVSRRKIFICRPTIAKEEETCAAEILKRLTGQAYRGTATADDLQDAMTVLRAGTQEGRLRERHPHGAPVGAREPALPVPHGTDAGDGDEDRRCAIASAIRIWRRACRSSCGNRCRTPS